MILVVSVGGEHFEDASGDVDRRRIEHGVVIGEGHVLEDHAVVILVERSPAAIAALHGENPVNGALHGLALVAPVGMLNVTQAQTNHGAVVHVRIELVVEFEIPAPGLSLLVFHFPIARNTHLFLQYPVGALNHAGIAGRNSALSQREQSVRRVPYRRFAGLHAERVLFLDAQLFKFIHGANHLGIVHRISQAAQGDDRNS